MLRHKSESWFEEETKQTEFFFICTLNSFVLFTSVLRPPVDPELAKEMEAFVPKVWSMYSM
jgi:hypothetical protein